MRCLKKFVSFGDFMRTEALIFISILWAQLDAMQTIRRFRIDSQITALASCPDGKLVAVGSQEGKIAVVDICTGRIHDYDSYEPPVTALITGLFLDDKDAVTALAIQKNNVAIGYNSGAVSVLDHTTDKICDLVNEDTSIRRIVVDDPLIATATQDSIVRVWDINTRSCLAALQVKNNIYALALSAAYKFLVVPNSKDIFVWDMRTNKKMNLLSGHDGYITALALKGLDLWSSSQDETIRCWDINTGRCRKIITHFGHQINALSASDNEGSLMLTGVSDRGYGFAWDVATGTIVAKLYSAEKNVQKVALGGNNIILGSVDIVSSKADEVLRKDSVVDIRPIVKLLHAYIPVINELPYPLDDITVIDTVYPQYNGCCSCEQYNCSQLAILCRDTLTGYQLNCTCAGQLLCFNPRGSLSEIKEIVFTEDVVTGKILLQVETASVFGQEWTTYSAIQKWLPTPICDNNLNLSVYTSGKVIKSIALSDKRENIVIAQALIAKKTDTDQTITESSYLWEIVGASHYAPYKLTVIADDNMIYECEIPFLPEQSELLVSIPPTCLPEPVEWCEEDDTEFMCIGKISLIPKLTLFMENSRQYCTICLTVTGSVSAKT